MAIRNIQIYIIFQLFFGCVNQRVGGYRYVIVMKDFLQFDQVLTESFLHSCWAGSNISIGFFRCDHLLGTLLFAPRNPASSNNVPLRPLLFPFNSSAQFFDGIKEQSSKQSSNQAASPLYKAIDTSVPILFQRNPCSVRISDLGEKQKHSITTFLFCFQLKFDIYQSTRHPSSFALQPQPRLDRRKDFDSIRSRAISTLCIFIDLRHSLLILRKSTTWLFNQLKLEEDLRR